MLEAQIYIKNTLKAVYKYHCSDVVAKKLK